MWYLYILLCSDGTLYTGITNNIQKRITTHNSGKGAKAIRGKLPVQLVYQEEFVTKGEALKREIVIKQMKRKEKQELCKL